MSGLQRSLSNDSLRYLQDRISRNLLVFPASAEWPIARILTQAGNTLNAEILERLAATIDAIRHRPGIHALQLDAEHALVVAPLPELEERDLLLATLLEGDASLARAVVANAIESWVLQSQLRIAQSALNESAAQLAHSFEQQDWLREFARNATTFSKVTAANQVADGILQPLSYLLRAQDVFLIVFPEETNRSGLVSANYGHSQFSVTSIRRVLMDLEFYEGSPPLVRNGLSLQTPEGIVSSLAAVVVSDPKSARAYLVAVNRSVDPHQPALSPEFGSSDVALLQEAAALLTTQAQNMHLLLQSNELFLGTLLAMSSAIDARDPYTQGHSERVARLSYELARILGLNEPACQEIYLSGILHDIGKIGIPDSVLLKPGKLSEKEFAVIKQHPEIGHRIVERLGHLHFTLPGILYHHERWDGQGYPHGLQGPNIPLMARIIAVADAFDAMTSCRPYRKAMPIEKAHAIIGNGAGRQWDAEVVTCFDKWFANQASQSKLRKPSSSIIPQDAPSDHLVQAVMTLIQ